tara:strand:+ start:12255 stop:12737 length:483 start_codon:yes stop_codon:yes gene_type:complete
MQLIIPNYHPLFVHFPIALSTLTFLSFLGYLVFQKKGKELLIVSKWSLWACAVMAILTVFAGWHAEGTIRQTAQIHDGIESHEGWALTSTGFVILLAGLGFWFKRIWGVKHKALTLIALAISFGLFSITAWHGGELVYRDGAGVMTHPTKTPYIDYKDND